LARRAVLCLGRPDDYGGNRVALKTDIGRIDLLAEPAGAPSFKELKAHALLVELDGFQVYVASIDDLISMKEAAGRPKDLGAVAELKTLKGLHEEGN